MLARGPDGVVLVAGAIPGERVRVEIERVAKRVTWARVVEVLEPSPSRRSPAVDPACGGLAYAHMHYDVQRQCKRDVVVDAFRRVGKITVDSPEAVASPEHGYRWRARFHVRGGRVGFFRENTHTLCDPAPTNQLMDAALEAVLDVVRWAGPDIDAIDQLILAENRAGTARVVHLVFHVDATMGDVAAVAGAPVDVDGVTVSAGNAVVAIAGDRARISDSAYQLFDDECPIPGDTTWTRSALAFFQANRFLTGGLITEVLASPGQEVLDLYAGVGLFSVACAARGARVTAVEGDGVSGADLDENAAPFADRVTVRHDSVEAAVRTMRPAAFDTVIVDPPRTGLSPEALDGMLRLAATQIVYVSCDPATLARDAAALIGAGYAIERLRVFDLFPNTAHVETIARFTR